MKKEISPNLKLRNTLALLLIVFGVLLISYMIVFEGELGALPLGLLLAGIVWFAVNRYQIKKQLE